MDGLDRHVEGEAMLVAVDQSSRCVPDFIFISLF
jgi:hypothetical protein